MKDVNKIVDRLISYMDYDSVSMIEDRALIWGVVISSDNALAIIETLKTKLIHEYNAEKEVVDWLDQMIQQLEITTESYEPTKF